MGVGESVNRRDEELGGNGDEDLRERRGSASVQKPVASTSMAFMSELNVQ
jgi:hypothetical protein